MRKADNLTTFTCRMSWKSGSLNLLEPSGPHRDCYGTALPFYSYNIKKKGYFRNVGKYSPKEKVLLVKRLDYPALISVSTSALLRTSYGYAAPSNESAMKNALNEMLTKNHSDCYGDDSTNRFTSF